MFKKIIAAFAALLAATAFAAVDVNKASQAELEGLKGIGPVISTLIISERKKGDFKDWNDLVVRVKGVGDRSAEKFSEAGLTVNGATFTGAPVAKKTETAQAPATARAASATRATASKAASAVKTGAEKAASGVKSAATTVKENARDEKNAAKENVQEAKDKRAAKKAEKAAAAASAPMKK